MSENIEDVNGIEGRNKVVVRKKYPVLYSNNICYVIKLITRTVNHIVYNFTFVNYT